MTTRKLTALALATLPEGDHPDPHCPGLIFRVQKRRRTWVFRTRRAGKRLRDRLGYFPQMGLKEARLAAGEAALRAESGLRAVPEAIVHPRAKGADGWNGTVSERREIRRVGCAFRLLERVDPRHSPRPARRCSPALHGAFSSGQPRHSELPL
ncbi:MAG TPA: Arm DNA-binding domain-containing protein [Mesorhizobium sp.]|nr:Arm DNA-binding domain-containing protein [Mesorhizobium sp.]